MQSSANGQIATQINDLTKAIASMSENQSVIATCVSQMRKDIAKDGKVGATSARVTLLDDDSNDIEAAAKIAKVSALKLQGILKTGRGNNKTKGRDWTFQSHNQDRS